ncbi:MAG TPA: hypothetical protein VKO18_00510 [Terriglobia bacterium]|nr:hypothetical protein [Terriglobia bacterium]
MAWRAFLADYTPMALQFLGVYSPWAPDARLDGWRQALQALSANECAALRGFSHQSEREFLVGLRAFLLDWIATKLESSQDAVDPPAPTVRMLSDLLSGLPAAHQEIAFLTLAGYSQATLEKTLRISPAVAGEGLGRLRASYAQVLERSEDRCLWPAAWLGICAAARADGQKDCTSLRQLIRILDGQASWYDKSPAEEHRTKCLHCLELWTSLLEVVAWDRARHPWPRDKIEPLIVDIPRMPKNAPRSLLDRLFGR